jgi:YHS domain-containing protein
MPGEAIRRMLDHRSEEKMHMENTQTLTTTRGRGPKALAATWRFTRHLLEMIAAMVAGLVILGIGVGLLGDPPGYDTTLGLYAYMGIAMSAPMVAWMRRMGHPWSDCWEMTAAMVLPMYALVGSVELGVIAMSPMGLMMWAHVAMVGGMIVLMLYRWDTYANSGHFHSHIAPVSPANDPVCGMPVDPATARGTTHQGAAYYFCAPGCRKAFDADPARYLAADFQPSM